MGSANGRHRRPRQAPAIIVAAGVTGSAIAIPLLGAAGAAHAADASTWDRVAECESGGMWSADLGNGYYGGLQLSQDTWSAYGGSTYASRADLASRSQQIAIGEKILDDQGPQAWPSCAVISGLATDGALPGVDPGGAPSTGPSDTATPSDNASSSAGATTPGESGEANSGNKGGTAGTAGNGATGSNASDASASPSSTPSAEAPGTSDVPDTPGATGKAAGKHRGAPETGTGTGAGPDTGTGVEAGTGTGSDAARGAGSHTSRGGSEAREGGTEIADGTYTVRKGDNLWAIADAQEVPGGWTALYEANKSEVGSDPDLILPGQDLDLGVQADTASVAGN